MVMIVISFLYWKDNENDESDQISFNKSSQEYLISFWYLVTKFYPYKFVLQRVY